MRFAFGPYLALLALAAYAQLPPDQKLSPADEREFRQELQRLEKLIPTAGDPAEIELQIANTYAAGGDFAEAVRLLRHLIEQNLGFNPSRDPDFAKLRDTAEFRSLMDEVRRQTPPVRNSRLLATLHVRDVRPENIAFDAKRNAFLPGNTARSEIVRCSLRGNCVPFVTLDNAVSGYVLRLKIDAAADAVWATHDAPGEASLRCYDPETGAVRRAATINGQHLFNDLAISSRGTVYVTDTAEGSVYKLAAKTFTLQKLAPQHAFTSANGMAISADEKWLYVSTWGDGIEVVDLRSETAAPIVHPPGISLAFIDGLYSTPTSLIAIQNGPMLPRIVAFRMSNAGRRIVSMRFLERRNPAFDGLTTGVLAGNNLYYIANPQIDKKPGTPLRPLQLFRLPLEP